MWIQTFRVYIQGGNGDWGQWGQLEVQDTTQLILEPIGYTNMQDDDIDGGCEDGNNCDDFCDGLDVFDVRTNSKVGDGFGAEHDDRCDDDGEEDDKDDDHDDGDGW